MIRYCGFLFLILCCVSAGLAADPAQVLQELGLSRSTAGELEVRVWLYVEDVEPTIIYRIYETEKGVGGQKLVWARVTHPVEGGLTKKKADRETNKTRELVRGGYCEPAQTENYLWCSQRVRGSFPWSVILEDLLPEQLWELPVEIERECDWLKEHGESVRIEVIEGDRYHSVIYNSPEFCCPHLACAIVDHARQVVRSNVR